MGLSLTVLAGVLVLFIGWVARGVWTAWTNRERPDPSETLRGQRESRKERQRAEVAAEAQRLKGDDIAFLRFMVDYLERRTSNSRDWVILVALAVGTAAVVSYFAATSETGQMSVGMSTLVGISTGLLVGSCSVWVKRLADPDVKVFSRMRSVRRELRRVQASGASS